MFLTTTELEKGRNFIDFFAMLASTQDLLFAIHVYCIFILFLI